MTMICPTKQIFALTCLLIVTTALLWVLFWSKLLLGIPVTPISVWVAASTNNTESNPQPNENHLKSLVSTTTRKTGFSSTDCVVKFKDPDIRLCHYLPKEGNFGDELGPAIATRILESFFECDNIDIKVHNKREHYQSTQRCLMVVGSIIHQAQDNDHMFGVGVNPRHWRNQQRYKNLTFYSMRGPKSEQFLQSQMRDYPKNTTIGYGDPGFLIPFLYPEEVNSSAALKTNASSDDDKICFVPHYHDLDIAPVNKLRNDTAVTIISPRASWVDMIQRLQQCSYIASTSLHGVILADSMGIPSLWVQLNGSKTQRIEGQFKYLDYFNSFAINAPNSRYNITAPADSIDVIQNKSAYGDAIPLEDRMAFARSTIASFPIHLFHKEAIDNDDATS